MINERGFIIKKNGDPHCRCYCRKPELIENYDKAIADKKQTWEVHHRLECCFTQKFLKKMNLYYDVEPEALIFLTPSEHSKIDSRCNRVGEAHKGKKRSEETKKKISEAKKGKLINRKDQSKKVLCLETGIIYNSAHDAYRKTGISSSGICSACRGRLKTSGGYHWKFYN